MNNTIRIMLELQSYWDRVLKSKSESERDHKSIIFWEEKVKNKKNEIASQQIEIKELKVTINRKEVELSEKDQQAAKLEARKDLIKSERELSALKSEIEKVNSGRSILEEELINCLDSIESKEKKYDESRSELNELSMQSEKDIAYLKDKINAANEVIAENQSKFEELMVRLPAANKPKFRKITNSHDGKAVALVKNEICTGCNFKVDFGIIQELTKIDSVVNCLNCGRFIYTDPS